MKKRTREIARAGIFGSRDNPQIVTGKDLREIAETFAEIKKAPVSLNGHWPDAAAPRLGNVTGVSYDEATQTLTGEIEEDDALAGAVDAGYYPDVSIGAKQRASDGRMYLHHLAYLGEEPPAIKDLIKEIKEDLATAAADAFADALAGRTFPPPTGRQLYLSDTPPTNTFDEENMEPSPKPGAGLPAGPAGGPGAAGDGGGPANPNEEAITMTEEEKKLREENERLKAENREKDLALSDAGKREREAGRERLKAAMDGAKVSQAVREKALRLSDSLEGGKAIELSDAEAPEGKRHVSPMDCLIEIIAAYPKPVETGVMNLSDGSGADGSPGNAGRINFSAI